jgi:hypothetical protein
MKKYTITSEGGLDMGAYEAMSEQDALDIFAKDAGYSSITDAEKQGFRLSVTATEIWE